MKHLFCFGLGYSANIIAHQLLTKGWKVSGTCRTEDKIQDLKNHGIVGHLFTDDIPLLFPEEIFKDVTHILISIPPNIQGDIVFNSHYNDILRIKDNLEWLGLFSTTGVYGDHNGAWVDETTPVNPQNARSKNRVLAEQQWLETELPVNILRLSGIYGKRSNAIQSLIDGHARIVKKENQFFSRIHVEDIANITLKSIENFYDKEIYNCADDYPCSTLEIMQYASQLLNIELPQEIDINDENLSEMARSFYKESRKVSNKKIKEKLNVELIYPTFKEGLLSILENKSL